MAACRAAASSIAPFSITATPVKRGKAVAVFACSYETTFKPAKETILATRSRIEASTMMTGMALHPRLRARASTAAPIGPSFSAISGDTLARVSEPVRKRVAAYIGKTTCSRQ